MGRSVSTPCNAQVVCYAQFESDEDGDDWGYATERFQDALLQ